MGMICDTARTKHRDVVIFPDSRKIFPQPETQFVRNQVFTILRAEHALNENVRIFVRHSAVPYGTRSCVAFSPALPCRAFTFRAYGTGFYLGKSDAGPASSQYPPRRRGCLCWLSHRSIF